MGGKKTNCLHTFFIVLIVTMMLIQSTEYRIFIVYDNIENFLSTAYTFYNIMTYIHILYIHIAKQVSFTKMVMVTMLVLFLFLLLICVLCLFSFLFFLFDFSLLLPVKKQQQKKKKKKKKKEKTGTLSRVFSGGFSN